MTLSAENAVLTIGKRRALDGVSATLARRQVSVIIGPNGAGKTSLLRLLAGLVMPDAGRVLLDGRKLASLPLNQRARRIGYLPQNGETAWNVTARELAGLGRLPHRSRYAAPSAEDEAAIEAALAATDTTHLAGRTVDTMSGGERARVKFARVLAGAPEWILADEPLANLDPAHQLDLLALFRAEADRGAGVVVVLHDLNQAARIADQLIVLNQGTVATTGAPAAVLTPALLGNVFGIAAEIGNARDGAPQIALLGRA
jgi:iron complex transport system ATP-binding protein